MWYGSGFLVMARGKLGGERGEQDRRASVLAEPARLELIDLPLLESLVCDIAPPGDQRPPRLLEQCVMLREIARRNAQRPRLIQAAAAAERAVRSVEGNHDHDAVRIFAAARLQQALCGLERSRLFAEEDGLVDARLHLDAAERALEEFPRAGGGPFTGPNILRARLTATTALAAGDNAAMAVTGRVFDAAIAVLDRRYRTSGAGLHDLALVRCERAELMISLGQRLKEAVHLQDAADAMEALCEDLDPDYLPQSLARAQILRGTALRALGECTGEAHLMKAAAGAFRTALDAIPVGHNPLDRARAAHGLGLALQGLAEVASDVRMYRPALFAMDRALVELPHKGLPLRAVVAHDRAACLARRAERSGDLGALAEAEGAFKAELIQGRGGADAVAWAVTQVALARIYEVRADLSNLPGERANAAYALTEALEVFSDRGLKTLSDVAQTALDRVRSRRLAS
jgi:tetratricopeptide (TPR) repeat protein